MAVMSGQDRIRYHAGKVSIRKSAAGADTQELSGIDSCPQKLGNLLTGNLQQSTSSRWLIRIVPAHHKETILI